MKIINVSVDIESQRLSFRSTSSQKNEHNENVSEQQKETKTNRPSTSPSIRLPLQNGRATSSWYPLFFQYNHKNRLIPLQPLIYDTSTRENVYPKDRHYPKKTRNHR